MENIKNIIFLTILVYAIWNIYKFFKLTKFAKIKILATFIFCGCIWCPIVLFWSVTHPVKATGYVAGYTAKFAYLGLKAKKQINKVDNSVAFAEPVTKYRKKATSMSCMPQEIAYDYKITNKKPKLGLGQRIWRGSFKIAGKLLWAPVDIVKTGAEIIGG